LPQVLEPRIFGAQAPRQDGLLTVVGDEVILFAARRIEMRNKPLLAWLAVLSLLLGRVARSEEKPEPAPKTEQAAEQPQADLPKTEPPKFVRVRKDDQGRSLAMETAVVRYLPAQGGTEGAVVDLIGAVHVGDKEYYDQLNKLFESYDVLLYELVAPEGTRIPKEGRKGPSAHPIGAMQDGMSAILELQHQLDSIDYTKGNFVHADMSPEEFAKSMANRGESFMQMFFRLMGQGMAQGATKQGMSDLDLLMALFSKDRALKLKTLMAEQFNEIDGALAVLDGPEGSTILTERNKRCFDVLDKLLKDGKKKIGIFYGAAHLPDMERRLLADFAMKRDSEQWLAAWNLQKTKADKPQREKQQPEKPQDDKPAP
jgi:hypothetical protein